ARNVARFSKLSTDVDLCGICRIHGTMRRSAARGAGGGGGETKRKTSKRIARERERDRQRMRRACGQRGRTAAGPEAPCGPPCPGGSQQEAHSARGRAGGEARGEGEAESEAENRRERPTEPGTSNLPVAQGRLRATAPPSHGWSASGARRQLPTTCTRDRPRGARAPRKLAC
ncbi:unnamed protein product, partial [Prorocentrum cordatum]